MDLDTFGKKKKKKKVKKTTFNLDDLENNLPDSSSSMNESNPIENGDAHGDSNAEVKWLLLYVNKISYLFEIDSCFLFYCATGRLQFGHGFLQNEEKEKKEEGSWWTSWRRIREKTRCQRWRYLYAIVIHVLNLPLID